MKLEVGEFYLNASGEIIKISDIHINNSDTNFYDSNSNSYSENGKFYADDKIESSIDLIAHIPKELHYKIMDIIKDYYTIPMIRDSINNLYEKRSK